MKLASTLFTEIYFLTLTAIQNKSSSYKLGISQTSKTLIDKISYARINKKRKSDYFDIRIRKESPIRT